MPGCLEWAKHWQSDESIQNLEKKPWNNEELRKLEEALPRIRECELEKCRDCAKQKQEWDVTTSTHPKVPLD